MRTEIVPFLQLKFVNRNPADPEYDLLNESIPFHPRLEISFSEFKEPKAASPTNIGLVTSEGQDYNSVYIDFMADLSVGLVIKFIPKKIGRE